MPLGLSLKMRRRWIQPLIQQGIIEVRHEDRRTLVVDGPTTGQDAVSTHLQKALGKAQAKLSVTAKGCPACAKHDQLCLPLLLTQQPQRHPRFSLAAEGKLVEAGPILAWKGMGRDMYQSKA